jgi:hypothetical protein
MCKADTRVSSADELDVAFVAAVLPFTHGFLLVSRIAADPGDRGRRRVSRAGLASRDG